MSSGSDHDVIAPDVAGRWRFRLGYLPIVVRVEFFGFVALISAGAVWIAIDAPSLEFRVLGWGMLAGLIVTLPVHEAGHWLTARSLGFRPQALVLRGLGVAVATDHSGMTRGQEDRVLLAGPATDLGVTLLFGGLFALAWWLPVPQLVAIALLGAPFGALVMLVIDLIPVPPSDMGRVVASRRRER